MQDFIVSTRKKVKKVLEKERYEHTKGVMYTAGCLAMAHGCDIEKAMTAGLLHDCAKCISNREKEELCKKYHIELSEVEKMNPFLIHAKLGAVLAEKQYGIKDEEIIHAIKVHTTGEPAMNTLDKIVFIADYIEPNRDKAPDLEIVRKMAFDDLNQTLLKILSDTLNYLNGLDREIDPMTKKTYDYYWNEKEI